MNKEDIRGILSSIPLFEGCDPKDFVFIKKSFAKGQPVPDAEGEATFVGILVRGEVDVLSSSDTACSQTVSTLTVGKMFGICNILARCPMPTALVCRKKATVAYMTKDHFVSLLEKYPSVSLRYARLCNEKIQFLARKLAFANIPTAREKLWRYLAQQAMEQEGRPAVEIPSKEMLGHLLGISHASLFRELAKLKREGLIEVQEKKIYLNKEFL